MKTRSLCLGRTLLNTRLSSVPALAQQKWRYTLARSLRRASEGLLRDYGYLCRFLPQLVRVLFDLPG